MSVHKPTSGHHVFSTPGSGLRAAGKAATLTHNKCVNQLLLEVT